MGSKTPEDTMRKLIAAFNAGDLDGALCLYDSDAVFIADPGKPAKGVTAIRSAMEGFLKRKPSLVIESQETIESGDVALQCTEWSLSFTGKDGSPVRQSGRGAVVLRRSKNGHWLVAIENPWAEVMQ